MNKHTYIWNMNNHTLKETKINHTVITCVVMHFQYLIFLLIYSSRDDSKNNKKISDTHQTNKYV